MSSKAPPLTMQTITVKQILNHPTDLRPAILMAKHLRFLKSITQYSPSEHDRAAANKYAPLFHLAYIDPEQMQSWLYNAATLINTGAVHVNKTDSFADQILKVKLYLKTVYKKHPKEKQNKANSKEV